MTPYFAYASNMSAALMEQRRPWRGSGWLRAYAFRGCWRGRLVEDVPLEVPTP